LIVLDDLQARLVASGLGIRVTGTIGILLAAKNNGSGPSVDEALSRRPCGRPPSASAFTRKVQV
jgi:predicted nucleic acid-binding protein